MDEIWVLKWTFSPEDYFEEDVNFPSKYGEYQVTNGKVELHIPSEKYPSDHSLRMQIHAELDARFLAAQVLAHRQYSLDKPDIVRLHPDGRRDVFGFPEGGVFKVTVAAIDVVYTDGQGNVIRDTKRERIDQRNNFAQLSGRFSNDPVASKMLRSYSAAVNDPGNELVHLYEIRDALSSHFGGETEAKKAIGVSNPKWSEFGKLANGLPLIQGRHRGKPPGPLRDATSDELSAAREIARMMIEGYLQYLKEN